jgi:predicted RNase H-like nuclease
MHSIRPLVPRGVARSACVASLLGSVLITEAHRIHIVAFLCAQQTPSTWLGMDIYIGFDSAWMDNPKAPGAICAVGTQDGRPVRFYAPQLASFDQALYFIPKTHSEDDITLVALDQPTVVPNLSGMRPVDRVAASLAGWLGGGVQPANRGRRGIFCDNAPVWRFLSALEAKENPEMARTATRGLFVMEVFPALALASMDVNFFGRLSAPKYNPNRKGTFRLHDWVRVAEAAARQANSFGCEDFVKWCRSAGVRAFSPTRHKR